MPSPWCQHYLLSSTPCSAFPPHTPHCHSSCLPCPLLLPQRHSCQPSQSHFFLWSFISLVISLPLFSLKRDNTGMKVIQVISEGWLRISERSWEPTVECRQRGSRDQSWETRTAQEDAKSNLTTPSTGRYLELQLKKARKGPGETPTAPPTIKKPNLDPTSTGHVPEWEPAHSPHQSGDNRSGTIQTHCPRELLHCTSESGGHSL